MSAFRLIRRTLRWARLLILAAIVLGAVGALSGRRVAPRSGGRPAEATITHAADGDTIDVRLADGRYATVRLLGIDTPETVRPGTPIECGGPAASVAMHAYDGDRVRLVADPSQDNVDRYGRLLRYAEVDGHDVGRDQLSAGLAELYIYEGHGFDRLSGYRRAADAARAAGRGSWSSCSGDFHRAEQVNP